MSVLGNNWHRMRIFLQTYHLQEDQVIQKKSKRIRSYIWKPSDYNYVSCGGTGFEIYSTNQNQLTMNSTTNKIKGNWNIIKGKLKQEYADLTDDDLTY